MFSFVAFDMSARLNDVHWGFPCFAGCKEKETQDARERGQIQETERVQVLERNGGGVYIQFAPFLIN